MSDDLTRLVNALARDVHALAGQTAKMRCELLDHRQAAGLAINALTEQLDELAARLDTVHREALRTATALINPKGAA